MPLATRGVGFAGPQQPTSPHPNRADIACFIGYVGLQPEVAAGQLPPAVERELSEAGWLEGPHARHGAAQLLDVPVTINSWESFTRLFAWRNRVVKDSSDLAATWLGAAVRSFFSEGGRECTVIRVGDPWEYGDYNADSIGIRIAKLIPGFPFLLATYPADASSWHGIGHLAGLPQVSMISLPDLAELSSNAPELPAPIAAEEPLVENWVECSEESPQPGFLSLFRYPGPRAERDGYARYFMSLSFVTQYIERYRRDVTFVSSVPRPSSNADIPNLFRFLVREAGVLDEALASPFLQLAYPWLRTRNSQDLPEALEPPESVLCGQLAANALLRGAFASATKVIPRTIVDLVPALRREEILGLEDLSQKYCFLDRVSLYGLTPSGIRLRSDVTTSRDPSLESASVCRLIAAIRRSARQIGEDFVFENSGENIWLEIEDRLRSLMMRFWQEGALGGATPAEAFTVRCNRTTMTQNDIDAGRLVAVLSFLPANPIRLVTVDLQLATASGGDQR
jgi:hypothetical protein